jgi:uncharacterized protein (DUF2461 family)
LKKVFSEPKFKKLFKDFWDEDKLNSAPKGFEKDHEFVEWLKLKSFIVAHEMTDKEVADKRFGKKVVEMYKNLKPLNDFLTVAIE